MRRRLRVVPPSPSRRPHQRVLVCELDTLTDAVPPFPLDDVDRIISAEYGAGQHVDTLFEQFDRVPVAAASLAPAHHASASVFA